MGKKGISPQISMVILVAFVTILLAIVALWGRAYIEELAQKRGALAEKQAECQNMELTVTKATRTGPTVSLVLKNTKGLSVGKFLFQVVGREDFSTESLDPLGPLQVKEYDVTFPEDVVQDAEEVKIIPELRVARGRYVPCSEQHLVARLE